MTWPWLRLLLEEVLQCEKKDLMKSYEKELQLEPLGKGTIWKPKLQCKHRTTVCCEMSSLMNEHMSFSLVHEYMKWKIFTKVMKKISLFPFWMKKKMTERQIISIYKVWHDCWKVKIVLYSVYCKTKEMKRIHSCVSFLFPWSLWAGSFFVLSFLMPPRLSLKTLTRVMCWCNVQFFSFQAWLSYWELCLISIWFPCSPVSGDRPATVSVFTGQRCSYILASPSGERGVRQYREKSSTSREMSWV